MSDLKVGDVIGIRTLGWVGTAEVVEIKDAGAVLKYSEIATHVPEGMQDVIAPNGDFLAPAGFGFVGRAHFHSQVKVSD